MSWITIGVSACECGDPHFSRRNERAAVTDRASFWHIANQPDPRFPTHRRFQKFLKLGQRRNSVEHDTGADDLVGRLIESERARALQHMRLVIARNRGPELLNV